MLTGESWPVVEDLHPLKQRAHLQKPATILEDMAAQCDGGAVPDCPIIDALLESG